MKTVSSLGRHHYLTVVSMLLVTAALIAGMVGCGDAPTFDIDPNSGEVLETIVLTSQDGMLIVTVADGTIALNRDGSPILALEMDDDVEPPSPPEDAHIIGLACDLGPAGATFDPAMTLTWEYRPSDIPAGVDEEDLVIAYYDEATGQWVILESVVDTVSNTVEASASHLTTFATVGVPSVRYSLNISSTAGGNVIAPGEGTFTHDEGTVVSLDATADPCCQFVNWTGDVGTVADVNAASTTITIGADYSVTANFDVIPPVQYSLNISSTTGGSVTTPGQGTFIYDTGTVVSLVADPSGGYRFVNWTGDVSTVTNVDAASTSVTMNGDYSVTANFVRTYSLTISSTIGGSVTTPGQGTFTYDTGTVVSLVATPASCCKFVNWTGDVSTIGNVNAGSTTISMSGDYSIMANFEPFPLGGEPIVCQPPVAPGRQTYSVSTPDNPRTTQVVLDPLDVNKCAWQEVTVWATDLVGNPIYQVIGEGRTNSRTFPFTLSLISGSETNGVWQGYWYNEDEYCLNYQIAISVTSASGTHVLVLTIK